MRLFLIIFTFFIYAYGEFSPSLKTGNELDLFLLRISNRYGIELPRSFYTKPMHAKEVLNFLNVADSLKREGLLTKQESYRLENIRRIISCQRNLFNWGKEEWETENYINLAFDGRVKPFFNNDWHLHMKGIINPGISGAKGNVSYFSEVSVWTGYQSDTSFPVSDYQPFNGNPYNLYGRVKTNSVRSSDIIRGGISFEGRIFDMETAVDYLRQGPALYYPLTFSGETSPVTYFRARMHLDVVEYVHTFGLLRTQKNRSKYFYTHRLDFPFFNKRFIVGINEVIINGSTAELAQTDSLPQFAYGEKRGFEWVYMIPFIPYSIAEHYLGDRDNAVLSFDFSVSFPKSFRWYLEFFLDDISSPLTLFDDDFGNKWALTAGGQFFGAISGRDITVSLEYSRIEPWVYTHFYGGSHRYTHYGQSLGSQLGPNSDALTLYTEYAAARFMSLGVFFKNRRKGVSRGSSINDVFHEKRNFDKNSKIEPDSKKKTFLGKDYKHLIEYGLIWKLTPFGIFTSTVEISFDSENKTCFDIYSGFSF